jgi:predicted nucleic acid-binding protein
VRAAWFADASFWIAISNRRDQFHTRAIAWRTYLVGSGALLVTTEPVLWEWLNALVDPEIRGMAADGYRRCHRDARIEVVPLDERLIEAALELFETRRDKSWSLTDCSSFVVMGDRKLTDALTADHHFRQAGLRAALLDDAPDLPQRP